MSHLYDAIPSSLRKPVEPSRFVQNLTNRSSRPIPLPAGEARAAVLSKSRFARLPQEPEDARLTGVTRSLNRRLLALNVNGTLVKDDHQPISLTRIA
jgi:hypothetical protein